MLAKDPDDRPQDAEALSRLLEEAQLDTTWSNARARHWWTTHLPQQARAELGLVAT